ncbi:MAG TPA: ABC transporter permease subunit [Caproicibacter sp.]|nr:ABC transporter permease subunit [Caproicibacter sp.]
MVESVDKSTTLKTAKTKKRSKKFNRDDLELTILASPATIVILVLCYLPMFGVIIAFKNFQLAGDNFILDLFNSPWCGFDNFKYLFSSQDAWIIIRNTVGYNVIFILLGVVIQVVLAMMLSELLNHFMAKTYQTIMMMPYFLSWIVVGTFVYAFLEPGHGLVNSVLKALNLGTVSWYTDVKSWPYIITFLALWKGFGYGTVLYLAAITGIDKSLYEAARIDGASKIQQARYVTLPGIKTVVVILLILSVGSIFGGDMGLFYIVPRQSGALYDATQIIDTYVYRALSGTGNIGMSSAAAFFQSVCGCIMVVVTNLVVRKIDPDSSLF